MQYILELDSLIFVLEAGEIIKLTMANQEVSYHFKILWLMIRLKR